MTARLSLDRPAAALADLRARASLSLVEVQVRCACRCKCHGQRYAGQPTTCYRVIDPGERDCSAGCRTGGHRCHPYAKGRAL